MPIRGRFFVACGAGLLLSFLLFGSLLYLQLGAPTESSHWSFEMNQRKLRFASRISGPKLLVVGGSGTLFGLQARLIEQEFGVPTVNFGTHAALGTDYLLRLVREAAKPGDTVLLVLEYELFEWGEDNRAAWAGDIYADYLMARDPEYFRSLPWSEQFELLMVTPAKRLKRGLLGKWRAPGVESSTGSVYDPERLEEHGDLTGHDRAHAPAQVAALFAPCAVLLHGFSPAASGFKSVRRFCEWARNNGIRVLATYPNLCYREDYDKPAAQQALQTVAGFYDSLGIPMVGSAREAMLPRSDFFNSGYHLTVEAAATRTQRLLPHLAPFLERPVLHAH